LMPMSGRYLLDTSILIALFAGEAAVKEHLAQAEETFIPGIAVGELCCTTASAFSVTVS